MDKPQPGGSRDESGLTLNMTAEELIALISAIAAKHPLKWRHTKPIHQPRKD